MTARTTTTNLGRRSFIAAGAAAAGFAAAQSIPVKNCMRRNVPEPAGGVKTVRRLRDAGFRSAMPVWGDRIA